MDGHQIDDVTGCSPVRGSRGLIRGKVNRMQHVAKELISLGREEAKVAVGYPLKLHSLVKALELRLAFAGLDRQPSMSP